MGKLLNFIIEVMPYIRFVIFLLILLLVVWVIRKNMQKKLLLHKRTFKKKIDNVLSKSIWSQIRWLFGIILFVFLFFAIGSFLLFPVGDSSGERFWYILSHFLNPGNFAQDVTGNSNLWIFLIGLSGMVFLSGILISVLSNIIERRVEQVKNGHAHYNFKNHITIIGYDRMTVGLIKQLAEKYKENDIVLQTIQNVQEVHHDLYSYLSENIEKRVVIVSGNRNSIEDLAKLHLDKSEILFLLGENDEYDHDSLNIECLNKIHRILKKTRLSCLRCNVLFENQSTYAIFQLQDIERIKDVIDFHPFNFYEVWAQKVLVYGQYDLQTEKQEGAERLQGVIQYLPLDREPITALSEKGVHLVIIGMSRMGVAMGVEAAHLCHFPNFVTKGIKTRITFIDENADREMNFLMGRYHHLFKEVDYFYEDVLDRNASFNTIGSKEKFTDIELEFIKGRIEYPIIQEKLATWSIQVDKLLTIAVCFNCPSLAIASGLYMPDEVYCRDIPILIRQETSCYALAMLSEPCESSKDDDDCYRKYANVRPFGMLDNSFDINDVEDSLPILINSIYSYFYDKVMVDVLQNTTTKDEIQRVRALLKDIDFSKIDEQKWQKLSIAKKWSNRYNANTVDLKMRSLSKDEISTHSDITLFAEVEHNRWNIEKLLMGFRATNAIEDQFIKSNPVLKEKLKTKFIHYDIRAYHDLKPDANGVNGREYDICLTLLLSKIQKHKISKVK